MICRCSTSPVASGFNSEKWLLSYLLTPWGRVLLKKLTGLQLVKKFPPFYRTRRFITALTSARHLSLSWASSIQSTHPHPTSRRSILILSSHLRLGFPTGLLPSGFPTKKRKVIRHKRGFVCHYIASCWGCLALHIFVHFNPDDLIHCPWERKRFNTLAKQHKTWHKTKANYTAA